MSVIFGIAVICLWVMHLQQMKGLTNELSELSVAEASLLVGARDALVTVVELQAKLEVVLGEF